MNFAIFLSRLRLSHPGEALRSHVTPVGLALALGCAVGVAVPARAAHVGVVKVCAAAEARAALGVEQERAHDATSNSPR